MSEELPNSYEETPPRVEGPFLDTMRGFLAEWQGRLRLQDWDIDLRAQRSYDMPENRATVQMDLRTRSAIIALVVPEDISPNHQPDRETGKPYEPELSLIHELVHLHLAPFIDGTRAEDRDTVEHTLMEAAVDSIAKGLWRAKYDGKSHS